MNVPDASRREPGTIAIDHSCAECGRSPSPGETWRLQWADVREAVTYCPGCAEREFGESGAAD